MAVLKIFFLCDDKMTRTIPNAANRVAARAAASGRRMTEYNKYKNAINALSRLRANLGQRTYTAGRITYPVYAMSPTTNNRSIANIRRKVQRVLNQPINSAVYNIVVPGVPTRTQNGRPHLGNTYKSENAINRALNRYYTQHVVPELLNEISRRTPGLRNAAAKFVAGSRAHKQRKANLKNYHIFLEGLYKIRHRN